MTTTRPHCAVCIHYMHAPMFVNNVVQAAQSLDRVNDILRLAVQRQDISPGEGYTLHGAYAQPAK